MDKLVLKAQEVAREKLAGFSANMNTSMVGQFRPKTQKRKKFPKGMAIIMPEEQTPDFWSSPAGAYLRGGALGSGTTAALGYALGGVHWSGRTKLFKKTKDIAKELQKAEKASPKIKALMKAKRGKVVRGMSLGGALAGMGATALYRHKAKKRQAELAKMPKQIMVPVGTAKIKTGARKGSPALEAPPKSEAPALPKAPGKSQKEQSVKITMAPINKAASDMAKKVLERLRNEQ